MTHEERYEEFRLKSRGYAEAGKKAYNKGDIAQANSNYFKAYVEMKYANDFLISIMREHGISTLCNERPDKCLGKECVEVTHENIGETT